MRKHIGKALQSRSSAIRTALDNYNSAARAIGLRRPPLRWEEVVEYAFLADFDLLRDARQDISSRPWTTPAGRLAMDLYFKISAARVEIERLNVEVKRVATYIQDEDHFLRWAEVNAREENPTIAHQIRLHRMIRGRFKGYHKRRLQDIARLEGFSGDIRPGISAETGRGESASVWRLLKEKEDEQHRVQRVQEEQQPEEDSDDDVGRDGAVVPEDRREAAEEAEAKEADDEVTQTMSSFLRISLD